MFSGIFLWFVFTERKQLKSLLSFFNIFFKHLHEFYEKSDCHYVILLNFIFYAQISQINTKTNSIRLMIIQDSMCLSL